MSSLVSIAMLAETLRIAAPYACAAVGGVWAERAGVVHIGLEGVLLVSAFASVALAQASGSMALGLVGGVALGVAVSALHAVLVDKARIDAVVSGIALNLLAFSATRLGLRGLYDSASNSPAIAGCRFGPTGPSGGDMLVRALLDPVTLLALAAIAASPFVLSETRFGLRVRAVGENPTAAFAAGVSVGRYRLGALAVSGAICALGGVHLAFDQHRFESGMSGGRGFIALAAVVLSGWRPARAAALCLAFGWLEALQIRMQDASRGSTLATLTQLVPYLATIAVLALGLGRRGAPAGLGRHAD